MKRLPQPVGSWLIVRRAYCCDACPEHDNKYPASDTICYYNPDDESELCADCYDQNFGPFQ
jgi:hypothetical protein